MVDHDVQIAALSSVSAADEMPSSSLLTQITGLRESHSATCAAKAAFHACFSCIGIRQALLHVMTQSDTDRHRLEALAGVDDVCAYHNKLLVLGRDDATLGLGLEVAWQAARGAQRLDLAEQRNARIALLRADAPRLVRPLGQQCRVARYVVDLRMPLSGRSPSAALLTHLGLGQHDDVCVLSHEVPQHALLLRRR